MGDHADIGTFFLFHFYSRLFQLSIFFFLLYVYLCFFFLFFLCGFFLCLLLLFISLSLVTAVQVGLAFGAADAPRASSAPMVGHGLARHSPARSCAAMPGPHCEGEGRLAILVPADFDRAAFS
jgi:hypothetical protein